MHVRIITAQGITPTELLIHTVTVAHEDDGGVIGFHCPRCGSMIQQIQGKVTRIAPGLEPYLGVVTMTKCYKCPDRYVFTTKESPSTFTDVTLSRVKGSTPRFLCVICRQELIDYAGPISLPQTVVCRCQRKYRFDDIVTVLQ